MNFRLKLSGRKEILLDCALLFLLAAVLIKPLFKARYLDKWDSIESTFIADARFLGEHLPHPLWQPLWYGGTRFDYIYPPAIRYGPALISKVTGFWPVKAYHFYTSFFYCVGIAGVYLLARAGMRSRGWAVLAGMCAALMSPSFLFMANMRHDAWERLPVRLGVLAKYGEGPHMTAFALIPIAMACAWLAFESRRPLMAALAGMCCAAVVSTNFYGATALVVFYPVLVWSFWITRQERRLAVPAVAIPLIAYGMTSFWLVPSYIRITSRNLRYVARPGNTWSLWMAVMVAIVFLLASDKFARGRKERTWAVFTAGCALFFVMNVLGNYYFKFLLTGDPQRLVPELDLTLIFLGLTALRWVWNRQWLLPRAAAIVVLGAAFYSTAGYVRHAWDMFPLDPNYTRRIEYRISEWLHQNRPDARTMATGSVRFWFDAWRDLNQLGGGSDQGVLNPIVAQAQDEIDLGPHPEASVLWLLCTGTDFVYVSDKNSQEIYKDAKYPQKFDGVLPVVYDNQQGDKLYQAPRRYAVRARVVDTARMNTLRPPRSNYDVEYLQAYADVIEKGPDAPPTLTRAGTGAMVVKARFEPGQSLVVQESYDPAWQARAGGRLIPVRKDAMGMMVVDAPPGAQEIHLDFVTPLENQIGGVVTFLTLLVFCAIVAFPSRWEHVA